MFAVSLGLLAAFCWSAHDVVARSYAERMGPFRMAFGVALAGAVVLLPFVLWRGVIWQAEGWALGYAVALGVVYAFALGGLLKAFSLAPVSIVGPMTAGYPALVVLWGLWNGLAPVALEWLGLALVLAGAIIVGPAATKDLAARPFQRDRVASALLAIIAANIGFSSAVVLGQTAAVSMGEMETTFVSRFPAALLLVPLLIKDMRKSGPWPKGGGLAILAMSALDVLAVTSVNAAGHFPNKEFAAMGVSAYGGLAVLLAMVVLKEKVSKGQWFGIALICIGIACLGWPKN